MLGREFNHPLERFHFPRSLTDFTFPGAFNQPIEGIDFTHCYQLTSIQFDPADSMGGHPFNHPIERLRLPHSLTRLDLSGAASLHQPISNLQLPPRLRFLSLPPALRDSAMGLHLPRSLRRLDYLTRSKSHSNTQPREINMTKVSDGSYWNPYERVGRRTATANTSNNTSTNDNGNDSGVNVGDESDKTSSSSSTSSSSNSGSRSGSSSSSRSRSSSAVLNNVLDEAANRLNILFDHLSRVCH